MDETTRVEMSTADRSILRDAWAAMLRRHHAMAVAEGRKGSVWITAGPERRTITAEEMARFIDANDPIGEEYLRDMLSSVMSTRLLFDMAVGDILGVKDGESTRAAAMRVVADRDEAIAHVSRLLPEIARMLAIRETLGAVDGEITAQTAHRVVCERDEARADADRLRVALRRLAEKLRMEVGDASGTGTHSECGLCGERWDAHALECAAGDALVEADR